MCSIYISRYQKCFIVVSPLSFLLSYFASCNLFQITIDITAPQAGFVHDGLYGTPEVDYQQDFHLNVHWSGFFDAESGVDYYKYIFSDHCWNRDDLAETTKVKLFIIQLVFVIIYHWIRLPELYTGIHMTVIIRSLVFTFVISNYHH